MPTKEERDARNEAERARYASLSPAERQKLLERNSSWKQERKEKNPEAHEAATKNLVQSRRERYASDPEYREQVKAYQRERARERRKAAKEGK